MRYWWMLGRRNTKYGCPYVQFGHSKRWWLLGLAGWIRRKLVGIWILYRFQWAPYGSLGFGMGIADNAGGDENCIMLNWRGGATMVTPGGSGQFNTIKCTMGAFLSFPIPYVCETPLGSYWLTIKLFVSLPVSLSLSLSVSLYICLSVSLPSTVQRNVLQVIVSPARTDVRFHDPFTPCGNSCR